MCIGEGVAQRVINAAMGLSFVSTLHCSHGFVPNLQCHNITIYSIIPYNAATISQVPAKIVHKFIKEPSTGTQQCASCVYHHPILHTTTQYTVV